MFCFIFYCNLGLSISISESTTSGHREGGFGVNSKRGCDGSDKREECNQGTSDFNYKCIYRCL